MGKKNAFVTTIGFNRNDPNHVAVAELLNSMKRGKAQYIVNAVLAYQGRGQDGEPLLMGQAPDYEQIRSFVLQVIEEHEGKRKGGGEVTGTPEAPKAAEVSKDMGFDLDDAAVEGIMSSLEAFRM